MWNIIPMNGTGISPKKTILSYSMVVVVVVVIIVFGTQYVV